MGVSGIVKANHFDAGPSGHRPPSPGDAIGAPRLALQGAENEVIAVSIQSR